MFREIDYDQIFKLLLEIYNQDVEVPKETKRYDEFPFAQAYKGQNDAIKDIIEHDKVLLCSPTGTGKTCVFGTAALKLGISTLVIEPRTHLQTQVCDYDFLNAVFLKARHRYPCRLNYACKSRFRRKSKWYFYYKDELKHFPCNDCIYEQEKVIARINFQQGGIVVLNQGNFWIFREEAEFVVVDEADEFVRYITSAISFKQQDINESDVDAIITKGILVTKEQAAKTEELTEDLGIMLDETRLKLAAEKNESRRNALRKEVEEIERELARVNKWQNTLQDRLKRLYFFKAHAEDCFSYEKGDKVYVEMFQKPDDIINKLFPGKVCITTATPFKCDGYKTVYYDIPFKAKVFVLPVGTLTVRNVFLRGHKDLLVKAAEVIKKISLLTFQIAEEKKAMIHCGNLRRHGAYLFKILSFDFPAMLHEEGKLEQTITRFLHSDDSFLLVTGAEYGGDWSNIPLQFILKVPYAAMDERLRALEKFLGKEEFERWYEWDALSRLIQASGRNARYPNQFGITIILDGKFVELYEKYENSIPEWFKRRLVWLKLKEV